MKFFVDTADIAEIEDLAATGLLDGVTTNPSLIAKSGGDFFDVIRNICDIVPGPVSAEVTATDVETMLSEGRALAAIAPNVAVKVPLTWDGLKACRALSQGGTKVNVTLCFSPSQALLAAKAGCCLHLALRRPARRYQPGWDGPDPRDRDDLPRLPRYHQRPRSWSPRSATRSTSWRPRSSAPMWRRCRRACCGSSRATRSPTRGSMPSSPTGRRRASRSSHD